jgi:hypothetical protein
MGEVNSLRNTEVSQTATAIYSGKVMLAARLQAETYVTLR